MAFLSRKPVDSSIFIYALKKAAEGGFPNYGGLSSA